MTSDGPSLVLDIQALQNPDYRTRGIGRYVTEHARALLRVGAVRALLLNPLKPFPPGLDPELATAPQLAWGTVTAFRQAGGDAATAHHITSVFEMAAPVETILPPHVTAAGLPIVVTLYDLIPLVRAETYLRDVSTARRYHARLEIVRSASRVLCISEHTRRQAIERLELEPMRAVTIGGGIAAHFAPPTDASAARAELHRRFPSIAGDYVMAVTGADDRKNTHGAIAAFARLPADVRTSLQLVVVCDTPDEFRRRWTDDAAAAGLAAEAVVVTGFVDDADLKLLYQSARVFLFPSFDEGFGLPVAEALACGAVAVTSAATSVPEIQEFPPATFDPGDTDEMASVLLRALTDEPFRHDLRAARDANAGRHTWPAVAKRTLDAVRTLPQRRRPGRRRPRLALVGPLPPEPSGIAVYNDRLAAALAPRCDLDLILEPASDARSARHSGATRRLPVHALGSLVNPASYDAAVYCIGNSVHHLATYDAALRYPGIVWFHDVRLHGLYLCLAGRPGTDARRFLAERLTGQYATRVPPELLAESWDRYEEFVRHGAALTRELLSSARAVIVGSEHARRLLTLDQPPDVALPPIFVVPHAIPAAPPRTAQDAGGPLIVSMGGVAPVKCPEVLIDALAVIRRQRPARLAFVGPVDDGEQRTLERYAEQRGVAEAMTFTNRVDESGYWDWLGRATLSVQLRAVSNGESSGAVQDAIAMGVATVTNVPSAAELAEAGLASWVRTGVGGDELADVLGVLLDDEHARSEMEARQRAFAPTWSFDDVAGALLAVVASLTGNSAP